MARDSPGTDRDDGFHQTATSAADDEDEQHRPRPDRQEGHDDHLRLGPDDADEPDAGEGDRQRRVVGVQRACRRVDEAASWVCTASTMPPMALVSLIAK